MELSQKAVELLLTVSNAIAFGELNTVKVNRVAMKELKDADMAVMRSGMVSLKAKGKHFLSEVLGNTNYMYASSLSGYEYTMIDKYVVSNKEGTFFCTDEVTFKRDRGQTEEIVTRVNVKKEVTNKCSSEFYWKLKV